MAKNNDLSAALQTIQQQYPEEAALIRQCLEFDKISRDNLLVLSVAMMDIRSKAQRLMRSANSEDDSLADLKRIEDIADNLHNVGSMMAKGEICNALHLYKRGSASSGTSRLTNCLMQSVYSPNPLLNPSDYRALFDLTDDEKKLLSKISESSLRNQNPNGWGGTAF